MAPSSPAAAQDIRGLEICTTEKQMDRRTACLQADVEFLQQALSKLERESDEKVAAAERNLAAARAEIAALRSTIEKLANELAQIKAKPRRKARSDAGNGVRSRRAAPQISATTATVACASFRSSSASCDR
jgi:chromosome segregation ATPase